MSVKKIVSLFLAFLFITSLLTAVVGAAEDETEAAETAITAVEEDLQPDAGEDEDEPPTAEETAEETEETEETPPAEAVEPETAEQEDGSDDEYILISDDICEVFYNAPAANSTFVESSGLVKARFVVGTTWTDLPYSSDVNHMEGIQFQTNSPYYYLYYRAKVKSIGWSDYFVSTKDWLYPGTYGYAVTNLEVKVYNNYIKGYDDKDYVIMYRSKVAGSWLSWVSNGSPEVMDTIKREFSLGGELDYYATDSGWASRGDITALQVMMFEKRTHNAGSGAVLIDAPYINQKAAGIPNGCESASAVMALQYAGIPIDTEGFVKNYLPMGRSYSDGVASDPSEVYVGDPHLTGQSGGWGCYAPVIVKAAKKAVTGKNCTVANVSGSSLSSLCSDYIDFDVPVIMWATVDMTDNVSYSYWKTPEGKSIKYNNKLHCLLLVGYDASWYYFNDPMTRVGPNKYFAYPKTKTESAYDLLGKQAVIVGKVYCKKIELLSYPTKTQYLTGEAFDPTGIKLLATYSDGSTKTITDCAFSGADTSTPGEKTVTFSYTDPLGGSVSGSFKIYVYDTTPFVVSIDIGRLPTCVEYEVGGVFDPEGLVVYAGYEQYVRDGDDIALRTYYEETGDYRIEGFDSSEAGKCTVYVVIGECRGSFEVTIIKVVLGDVNGDGIVSMKDVLLLRRVLSALEDESKINRRNSDVTRDGIISMKDVLLLRKYLANIESF